MKVDIVPWLHEDYPDSVVKAYSIWYPNQELPETDAFFEFPVREDPAKAERLASFIDMYLRSKERLPDLFRHELRAPGGIDVYAIYDYQKLIRANLPASVRGHDLSKQYSDVRLLLTFPNVQDTTWLIGSGFLKTDDSPLQARPADLKKAQTLGQVARHVQDCIERGELEVKQSLLTRDGEPIQSYRIEF